MRRSAAAAAAAATAALALCGCGRSNTTAQTAELRGLAAASLTQALGNAATGFHANHRDTRVTFSFEGSQQVVAQLRQGAPADLAATANPSDMAALVRDHLVAAPTTFARNHLEILVAPGNPKHVTGLADLARPDLAVVLAAPEVPAGKYAAQILRAAGVTAHPRSLELDVKSVVRRVTLGEADAAIVYVTDVRAAGANGAGVEIPAAQNVTAEYQMAVAKTSTHERQAQQFIASLLVGDGHRALVDQGFASP